jgi:hypothetical protein
MSAGLQSARRTDRPKKRAEHRTRCRDATPLRHDVRMGGCPAPHCARQKAAESRRRPLRGPARPSRAE